MLGFLRGQPGTAAITETSEPTEQADDTDAELIERELVHREIVGDLAPDEPL